jgi:hypothetical protein
MSEDEEEKGKPFRGVLRSMKPSQPATIPIGALVTRPRLRENMARYYNCALEGKEADQKWLRTACALTPEQEYDPEKEEAMKEFECAKLLQIVLDHPQKFRGLNSSKAEKKARDLLSSQPAGNTPSRISVPREVTFPPMPFFALPPAEKPLKKPLEYQIPIGPKPLAQSAGAYIQKDVQPKTIPAEYNQLLQKGAVSSDPLIKAEFGRLQQDLAYYQTQPETVYSISDLSALEAIVSEDPNNSTRMRALKTEIIQLANQFHEAEGLRLKQYELLRISGQLKALELEELIVNFGRQKPELLQKRNPTLTEKECTQLYQKITEYLLYATAEQQRMRAKEALHKLKEAKDPEERKSLEEAFIATCLAERQYALEVNDPVSSAYLVFEYFGDLLLRPAQKEKLELFLKGGDQNPVLEMIMGSGKSKVLLVLLGVLRADGKAISTIVTSPSFFRDVAAHTHGRLHEIFGQTLTTIHFNRETPVKLKTLQPILATLQTAQAEQNCIIVTSKTLHCLMLRYLEEWFKLDPSTNETPKELEVLREILTTLFFHNKLLIDELDTVLNVLHSVSFSLGTKSSFSDHDLFVFLALYRHLYSDPDLKQLARLDSDPSPATKAPSLTRDRYNQILKPALASKFLEGLKTNVPPEIKYQKVPEEVGRLSKEEKDALIDFLCQDIDLPDERLKKAQEAYDQLSSPLKQLIAAAAGQIGHLFEHTLIQPCDEKYGLHSSSLFAIPFSSAHVASVGSEFAKPMITFNYTIQAYIKNGLETPLIRDRLEAFLKGVEESESETKKELLIKWQEKLSPYSLKTADPKIWEAIQKRINAKVEDRMEFVADFILPEMRFFTSQISSNPINCVSMAKEVTGFTGTLWNKTTYDSKLKAYPENGIDSKTLTLLNAHSNRPVIVLDNENPEEILARLNGQGINFDMICDNGAYFKSLTNKENARLLAKQYKKPVVFYDRGRQTITDGASEKPYQAQMMKEGTYLTFLDQENTTGADVSQKPTAQSVLTIKQGVLLRDILQSVWRLRGLDKGQTVQWVVSPTVEQLIRSDLQLPLEHTIILEDILNYAIQNQAQQIARHNEISCTQQLQAVKQQLLVEVLLSNASLKVKQDAVRLLKPSWIKQENTSPSKQYVRMAVRQDTLQEMDKEAQQILDFLNKHIEPHPRIEQAKQKIEAIKQRYSVEGMMPKEKRGHFESETVEVEKETLKEVEKEIEREQEMEHKITLHYFKGTRLVEAHPSDQLQYAIKEDAIPYISMTNYCQDLRKQYAHLGQKEPPILSLDPSSWEGIDLSFNFFEVEEMGSQRAVSPSSLHLYRTVPKEFDYMLMKNGRITLLSQQDAEVFFNDPDLYSLKSKVFVNQPLRTIVERERELLVRIKFLSGTSSYNQVESSILKKWLKQQPPRAVQKFFEKVVLRGFPHKRAQYRKSFLKNFFDQNLIKRTELQK